jgi:hypothetical protein
MKNKVIIILAVLISLVLVSTQAYASPIGNKPSKTPSAMATQVAEMHAAGLTGNPNGKPENYKGTISSVDAGSITVTLKDGSAVTIALGSQTRIRIPKLKDATPADLKTDMKVMVLAIRAQDDSLTAKAVVAIPGKPAKIHRVGTVTAYAEGASITIQDKKDGQTYTFLINAETKILPEERVGLLGVGALVTIICPRDVTGGNALAAGIVVHPVPTE